MVRQDARRFWSDRLDALERALTEEIAKEIEREGDRK